MGSNLKVLRFADVPTIKGMGFLYMLAGVFFVVGGVGFSFSSPGFEATI
ncbi:hypothetical protein [Arthrobacter sp. ISL-30]|nr:hypothetical protein [Arthrobacter sp. ISL-30]MBT2515027.1 hypothetical protein [Arthrobacter sp. ISL-30]